MPVLKAPIKCLLGWHRWSCNGARRCKGTMVSHPGIAHVCLDCPYRESA